MVLLFRLNNGKQLCFAEKRGTRCLLVSERFKHLFRSANAIEGQTIVWLKKLSDLNKAKESGLSFVPCVDFKIETSDSIITELLANGLTFIVFYPLCCSTIAKKIPSSELTKITYSSFSPYKSNSFEFFFDGIKQAAFTIKSFFANLLFAFKKINHVRSKKGFFTYLAILVSTLCYVIFALSVPKDPALQMSIKASEMTSLNTTCYGRISGQPLSTSTFENTGLTVAHLQKGDYVSNFSFYVFAGDGSYNPFSYIPKTGDVSPIPAISSPTFDYENNMGPLGITMIAFDRTSFQSLNSVIINEGFYNEVCLDSGRDNADFAGFLGTQITLRLGSSATSSRIFTVAGVAETGSSVFNKLFGDKLMFFNDVTRTFGYSGESFYFLFNQDINENYAFLREAMALQNIYGWKMSYMDNSLDDAAFSSGQIMDFSNKMNLYYNSRYYLSFLCLIVTLCPLLLLSIKTNNEISNGSYGSLQTLYLTTVCPIASGLTISSVLFIVLSLILNNRVALFGAPFVVSAPIFGLFPSLLCFFFVVGLTFFAFRK